MRKGGDQSQLDDSDSDSSNFNKNNKIIISRESYIQYCKEVNAPRHPKIDVGICCEKEYFPEYESKLASGCDLKAKLELPYLLSPKERVIITTGIKVSIPIGYELQIRSRSGLAVKYGIIVLNSPGSIDADYRGEIRVILYNTGENNYLISDGDRIAQAVICPIFQAHFNLQRSSLN